MFLLMILNKSMPDKQIKAGRCKLKVTHKSIINDLNSLKVNNKDIKVTPLGVIRTTPSSTFIVFSFVTLSRY